MLFFLVLLLLSSPVCSAQGKTLPFPLRPCPTPSPGLHSCTQSWTSCLKTRSLAPELPCHLPFCPTLSDTHLPAELQGPGGGSYFYVSGEEQGEIQGVRIFVGMMGLIKGIQLRFGEHWSPRYGAPGGRAQEFLLWTRERITAVAGSARACIRHLRLITSRGRQATFGRPVGRRFSAHPPAAGQQLLSANGQHRLFCLSGIGFKWGFAPEKLSAQGPAAVTGKPTTSKEKGVSERSPAQS